jgi:hypothetical protein
MCPALNILKDVAGFAPDIQQNAIASAYEARFHVGYSYFGFEVLMVVTSEAYCLLGYNAM